jgi:Trypsin-like peptidase domain
LQPDCVVGDATALMPEDHVPPLDGEREKWKAEHDIRLREIALLERETAVKEADQALRREELAMKRAELALKEKEQQASTWRSPLVVAILAAAVAAAGNAVIALVNGNAQVGLEERKAEQTRILEMIKTSDPEKATNNLKFLLESGLIADASRAARLREYLSKRPAASGPVLPAPAGGPPPREINRSRPIETLPHGSEAERASNAVGRLASAGNEGFCTAFLVAANVALTAGYCAEGAPAAIRLSDGVGSMSYKVTGTERNPRASSSPDTLDYALVHLDGDAGKRFGVLRLNRNAPVVGQPLIAIMFESTTQKLVDDDAGACRVSSVTTTSFAHRCSTRAGSGGAPILDVATMTVVGIEHSGGANEGERALRIDAILEDSPSLRALVNPQRGAAR